ncbi:hypothetical protein S7711_04569 [Stachybotrys chartarum IBT 7711]|uniref:RRM domain-containing protein n=1 Tax=Stachybotrys chartarum (strain CBS 109288 / IBT 7711) TaxID=1280523 RepID=A0A084APT8_STACB|nr:hypothetical protein S7711_04569 [Stachybotrys chartarum IBT 7711]
MGTPKGDRKRSRSQAEDTGSSTVPDLDNASTTPTSKKPRVEARRSLFVRSLPPDVTSESLTDFFSQYFPVKHATVVVDQKTKESRGFGFVTLADAEDASEAKKALDKKKWNGRNIRIDIAEPRQRSGAEGQKKPAVAKPARPEFEAPPKLIVRNLPWSIRNSEQLGNLFRSFGKVKYADLPNNKGKLKGFGFVTLRGKKNAEAALEAINGKEIDGRTLAVDWAVDKQTWEQKQLEEHEGEADGGEDSQDNSEAEPTAEQSDEPSPAEDAPPKSRDDALDADLANFMKNHMQNMEDEDEDEEDEDEDEDEEGDEGEGDFRELEAEKRAERPRQQTTDNSSTVFVRNVPFTTTDEGLKDFFGHFGKVRYARVVIDKATDKPAGTGFVCFFDGSDAKTCIKNAPRPQAKDTTAMKHSILQDENADPTGKYTLEGRLLQVAQAVNKEDAENLASSSMAQKREKDKRRLYLLAEGAIGKNNPIYDLLAPSEIQMRQASAAQRRKLVQGNPSLHLSLTRLALRNIPRNIGSKELKELARKAVVGFAKDVKEGRRQPLSKEENARDGKDAKEKEHQRRLKGKGIVRQAKIVFESQEGSKVTEKSGAGKSRGYGFIEYTSHHWALMGLRYLNGYQLQDANGRKQRLIAEFSIENAQVVQRRRTTEGKSGQPAKSDRTPVVNAGVVPEQHVRSKGSQKLKRNFGQRRQTETAGKPESKAPENNEPGSSKDAMKQTLIARKRLMRKKKANARSKN